MMHPQRDMAQGLQARCPLETGGDYSDYMDSATTI